MWKLANVTPIFKKGDKQSTKNYRHISLLPICDKMFEKIISNLYLCLNSNNLITKNQSGPPPPSPPGDSTTNQLLFLVDEIHQVFEDRNSLEVRAVFLDISKAFDKMWHEGLLFKLKENGITGSLLKLFENYLHNRKQRVVLPLRNILKLNLGYLKVLLPLIISCSIYVCCCINYFHLISVRLFVIF